MMMKCPPYKQQKASQLQKSHIVKKKYKTKQLKPSNIINENVFKSSTKITPVSR